MDDYMDKRTAANLLDNLVGMVEDTQENDYDTALRMGIEALKAEVQPVVRCRDCNDYQTKFRWCKLHDGEMQPTDFCSYGERRGSEQNDVSETNVGNIMTVDGMDGCEEGEKNDNNTSTL